MIIVEYQVIMKDYERRRSSPVDSIEIKTVQYECGMAEVSCGKDLYLI